MVNTIPSGKLGKFLDEDEADEDDSCSWRATFCPKRYPQSVASEYKAFQTWDTIQQMTKLVNSRFGQLAWFAFHGVGQPSASVPRAVLFSISRNLFGHKVSMLGTTPQAAQWFAAYVKTFRALGGTLEAIGVITEILAFQANNILFLWAAGMLGAMAAAMNGLTRACILQHFAKEKNNHDVILKENNQDNAGSFVGVLGGLVVVYFIGSGFNGRSQTLLQAAIICGTLCLVHASTNLASAMVLRVPPGTFKLQHCKSRRYVTVTSGNALAATADEAADVHVELFKLPSDQIPGKALMSADGLWFDQDGMVTDAAVAALVEEDGQSLILRGERYALQACPSLPSNSNFRSSLFFPPGWPTTMPTGFDEWVAYDLMTAVVESPMMLLELFIYWKYLAGVGDSTKSPAFACLLLLYVDCLGLVFGFLSGLPRLAKHYDHRWLILGNFLGKLASGVEFIAMVCPLNWYLLLVGLVTPFKTLGRVARKTVSAELERRFASHPNVELIHLSLCAKNRKTVLNLLSSILCLWYAFHMNSSGLDPSLPGIMLTYFMLLFNKLFADYMKDQVASKLLTGDQAVSAYDLIEDEAHWQPLRRIEETSFTSPSSLPSSRSRFSAKKFAMTLLLVLTEAAVYAGLVTTLSTNKDQLEPCTERCLQFKLVSDGSAIPSTGIFPFPLQNGQNQRELQAACVAYGAAECQTLQGSCSATQCEERHVRRMVEDQMSGSRSKLAFIASIAVYSALNLAHDVGLEAHLLGPNDAAMLQIMASFMMAIMTACALMWASGAMELFYSPAKDDCGCYFRLAAVPSLLALALPLNLVSRLRYNVQQAMYAAIIESSCLRTVSFAIPYHFVESSEINDVDSLGRGSLLGVRGLGCPRRSGSAVQMQGNSRLLFDRFTRRDYVKRWAQRLPLLAVSIVLLPLLFSSSFIIYRSTDLFLSWLESWLGTNVLVDRSCGTLALFGVYSMIGMQALVVGYFLSGLWTLYSVLAVQLGDWASDPKMIARLLNAKPELRWALRVARRSATR